MPVLINSSIIIIGSRSLSRYVVIAELTEKLTRQNNHEIP